MTLIWAKQIVYKDKPSWALFTDDGLTAGQKRISACGQYRPKLREINWGNVHLIIASCWNTKDIDYTINAIEANLPSDAVYDVSDLQACLQQVIYDSVKEIKELKESDVQVSLLILETKTNTLWATEEYSLFRVNGNVEIVFGSAEQAYHNIHKWFGDFYSSFQKAIESDEYCEKPIWVYYLWEVLPMADYQVVNPEENILQLTNLPDDECTPREDRDYWMTYGFSWGEAEVLW